LSDFSENLGKDFHENFEEHKQGYMTRKANNIVVKVAKEIPKRHEERMEQFNKLISLEKNKEEREEKLQKKQMEMFENGASMFKKIETVLDLGIQYFNNMKVNNNNNNNDYNNNNTNNNNR
jgi:DNA-binding ferritin-like protein (Dps family)